MTVVCRRLSCRAISRRVGRHVSQNMQGCQLCMYLYMCEARPGALANFVKANRFLNSNMDVYCWGKSFQRLTAAK